jgi:SAM-dependent methyltransferase
VYWPGIFEARTLEAAKATAVTPEKNMSTEERWTRETEFTIELIASRLTINEKNRVLDFGCGAGRMSRALIGRFGCSVVGVDQAQNMREHAIAYVDSPRFTAVSPEQLDAMVAGGYAVDFGLACWVLQHCMYPALQVARIANALGADAPFLLVNSVLRLIPTNLGWRSDGEDLDALMAQRFAELERLNFPPEVAAEDVINSSSISWWQRSV